TGSRARRRDKASTSSALRGGSSHRQARRSIMASAPSQALRALPARPTRRGAYAAGEIARYLGAVSILAVGVVHAQQYYSAYFSFVPTIGTPFFLSVGGCGLVGVGLLVAGR